MTPTTAYPALFFYDSLRLGKGFNLATHKIFGQIMWSASSSAIKQFWMGKFGHAPENFSSPFSKQNSRRNPTIVSCSKHIFHQPADWPKHTTNTGYWFDDQEIGWQPAPELLDFLEKGPAPVYVGFGSLGDPAIAVQTTELVIEALKNAGKRGILATGWSGLAKIESIPEEIFILESAPHTWLFPRMAAVVHHGCAGTTAAGLKAGVPGIIIPHSNDQFAWGRRVFELGVGTKPIPRKNLTAERLSAAIKVALSNEIRTASKELGIKIQSEDGARTAAKIIINCFDQKESD